MSDPRRKVMKEAVCLLLSETGFDVATEECIETLVEMLSSSEFRICFRFVYIFQLFILLSLNLPSVMSETANQTKNYAELAGRTQPVVGDVVMAMINMGMTMKDVEVKISSYPGYPDLI